MQKNYDLLTITQAAEKLQIGRSSMYALIHQGLPHIRIGKQIRIPRESLEAWVKEHLIVL